MVKVKHVEYSKPSDTFIANGARLPRSSKLKYSLYKKTSQDGQYLVGRTDCGAVFSNLPGNNLADKYCIVAKSKSSAKTQVLLAQTFFPVFHFPKPDASQKTKKFGDQVGLQSTMRKKRNEVDINRQISKDLTGGIMVAAQEKKVQPQELVEKEEDEVKKASVPSPEELLPPRNTDATFPEEVYNIEDVVPEAVLKLYEEEAKELEQASVAELETWAVTKKIPKMVLNIVPNIFRIAKEQSCRLLVHYSKLCKVAKLTAVQLRNPKDLLEEIDNSEVKTFLTNLYLSSRGKNRRTIVTQTKDTLLVHAMLVALYASNAFTLPLDTILEDLGTTSYKMNKLARAAGCHVSRTGGQSFIKLSLPLFKPIQRSAFKTISKY